MNIVVVLDSACLVAFACAALLVLFGRSRRPFHDLTWILAVLLSLQLLRDISNIYAWSGLSSFLERIEDYPGLLEPLVWGFLVYTIIEAIQRRELIDREQRYRLLAEHSTDVIITLDLAARVTYVSPAVEPLTGFSVEEMIGQPIYSLLDPQAREVVAEVISQEFRRLEDPLFKPDRGSTFRLDMVRCDGRLIHLEITRSFLRNEHGAPVGILANARDITKRYLAEQQLKDSEDKFSSAFQHAPLFMAISALEDGRLLEVNDRFCEITGYTRHEALTRTSLELRILAPETRAAMLEEIAARNFFSTREMPLYTKSGETFFAEVYATPIIIAGQSRLLLIALDVTERRKSEQERAELENRLRQTQKLEAIGTLAGGIAHDFNNILFAILGNTDIALEEVADGSQVQACLQEIRTAGQRAAGLVRQILFFARRSEVCKEALELGPIVKEVLKLLRATSPAQIEFRSELQAPAAKVIGDSTQIHQLLINLCTNAIQALLDGGGTITVTLKECTVTPELVRAHPQLKCGSYVQLVVEDTGPGIASELLDLIFEPFFTTKGVGEGTGLGLAVVHGIVTGMEGVITVSSEPGSGAVFKIYLPAAQTPVAEGLAGPVILLTGNERIMLVEDEEPVAHAAGIMLSSLGYRVTVFTASVDARQAFIDSPADYDLVITDLAMPQLTGEQLAVTMLQLRADLPIILATGFSYNLTEDQVRQVGIRECLIKPFSKQQLAEAVRRALDQPRQPLPVTLPD